MCGRFSSKLTWRELHALYSIHDGAQERIGALNMGSHMNICPTDPIVIVRNSEAGRAAARVRWSLVPPGWRALQPRYAMHNARADSLMERPSFRAPFEAGRRCLIPASGFYEWKTEAAPDDGATKKKKPKKTRYYIRSKSGAPLTFAGPWERNTHLGIESATMICTDPNAVMAPIHDRMPVILAKQDWESWLAEPRLDLLVPAPVDDLIADPVRSDIEDEDPEESLALA